MQHYVSICVKLDCIFITAGAGSQPNCLGTQHYEERHVLCSDEARKQFLEAGNGLLISVGDFI